MSTQQLKIHNHQCEHCGMRYKCDNRMVVVTGSPVAFVLPVLKI
jgi:hypothetical protein